MINLTHIHPSKISNIIYPVFAKEFWQIDNYETFANLVNLTFELNSDQWDVLLEFYEQLKKL